MSPADTPGPEAHERARYRFGDIAVDTHARTVARAGAVQTLEPKAYDVLMCLLRQPGELVTRDALLDHVWGHRHVTPGVLTRAIAQLRHALGDDVHAPKYIRTRHSLGYCFIGALLDEAAEAASGIVVDEDGRGAHDGSADRSGAVRVEPAVPAGSGRRADAGEGGGPPNRPDHAAGADAGHVEHPPADVPGVPRPVGPPAVQTVPRERRAPVVRSRRAVWFWVGALVLLAFGLVAFDRLRTAPAPEPSVAVLPFTSADISRDGRYFAEGLALEMHDALARVPGLRVVAVQPSRSGAAPDPVAVGQLLHVSNVLEASVRRDGGRVRVDARLTEPRTGLTRWSGQFDRADADVFDVQAEIAREVVQALLGALPDRGVARRLAPTSSPDAYDAYLLGLQALHAGDGDAGLQRAIGRFREALTVDPGFARAQAGICRAEIELFENGLSADAFERADAACRQAARMAPQLREVDLALGQLHRARGDYPRAVRHFTRALDDVALRAPAHIGLGRAHDAAGRSARADAHFEHALRLGPNDASVHRELGYRAYLAGDLPRAIEAYRSATALAPDDERLWSSLGGLYLASGDEARAAEAFERSLAVRPNYAALSNYGSLRYEARAYTQAADLYRRAAALDPADFRTWGNLGDALSAAGDRDGAESAYRRGSALAQPYTAIRNNDAQALALLGWYRANLGEAAAARDLIARAAALGTEPGEVAFLAAQVHALLGDAPAALAQAGRARRSGISDARLAASPVLAPLLDKEGLARR